LRREAEKAKRSLSSETQVRIEVENIMDGIDFSEPLTRAKFESLNKDLFKKTVEPIQRVLKVCVSVCLSVSVCGCTSSSCFLSSQDTDIRPAEVDHIVMVGGSSRIPYIRVGGVCLIQ
jgi:heat shock protein 5